MRVFDKRSSPASPSGRAPLSAPAPAVPHVAGWSPVLQRFGGGPVSAPAQVQRAPDQRSDPARFETAHQNLFVKSPTLSGKTPDPWQKGTTDAEIRKEFRDSILGEIQGSPLRAVGQMNKVTSQTDAETAAVSADVDLHAKYPQIPKQLGAAAIRGSVVVFAADFEPKDAPDPDFLKNWVENQLPLRTKIEEFAISPKDPDYVALVKDLAQDSAVFPIDPILDGVRAFAASKGWSADETRVTVERVQKQIEKKPWSWLFNRMSSRTAAFEGQGKVNVSESLPVEKRRATLLHELLHHYADADYRRWVDSTKSSRLFNEGFTEILTREALTAKELSGRKSYQDSVDVIRARVMPFISIDDLARAYFLGEVWRIEGKSQVSQEMFEKQAGLAAGAARADEVKQSKEGPGIVQTVEEGAFYRLLNFGTDQSVPKTEHEKFVSDVLLPKATSDSALRLRFVGHADETGPAGHNQVLAQARAAAVYKLALKLGIPRGQLVDVDKPAGGGEKEPTAGNADVHGRAMNRRVEIFLTHQP
jgi:outer membrane protein OmpA-like peptidoglycan-associated protein